MAHGKRYFNSLHRVPHIVGHTPSFWPYAFIIDKPRPFFYKSKHAGVVKLVDAEDSKSSVRKDMPVRVRPPAP